jgi:hypothetical protein
MRFEVSTEINVKINMGCVSTQSCKWLPNFRKQPQLVAEISCYNAIEHSVTTLHITTHKITDCNDK